MDQYGDRYFYNDSGMSREAYLCKCGVENIYGNESDAVSVAKHRDADACMVDWDRAADGYVHVSYHHPWCPIHDLESWIRKAMGTKNRWEAFYRRTLYSEVIPISGRLKSLAEMKKKYPHCFVE